MTKIKKEYQPYTLGLDIGIASAGAAILGETRILGMHVRPFDRAATAKEGESLNKFRREARGECRCYNKVFSTESDPPTACMAGLLLSLKNPAN